jgi:phenylacetate-coenzyme A ligase PaaK-like adenylate-forming protein
VDEISRSFLASLRRSQWLTSRELALYQAPLIERLCRHAMMHTPFYRDRLRRLFDGGDGANGRFRVDRWSETPIFGRAEAQVAGSTLFAAQTPPDVGEARVGSTSGSTGRPLDYRVSALVDFSANATFTRCLENSGCDLSGTLGYIKSDRANDCQPPLGSSGTGWNQAVADAPWFAIAASSSIGELVEWLKWRRPNVLMSYPSIVSSIMSQIRRDGDARPVIETVVSLGENLHDGFAESVREVFGARHIDIYGASEVGTFAYQCPTGSNLHVAAETTLVEILRDDGKPARVGEIGHVVATALHSYAGYVPGAGGGRADEAGAARFLRSILSPDIAVDFTAVPSLSRTPSGKFQDFISLVDADEARSA